VKRLKWLIALFCLAVSIPMGYVIWRSYEGLAREERAQLRFFMESQLDEIEKEMANLVLREESRPVDAYHHTLSQDAGLTRPSPLSRTPEEPYILGYLQNNPDGSFQTPLVSDFGRVPPELRPIITQLRQINALFNTKRLAMVQKPETKKSKAVDKAASSPTEKGEAGFAERYLSKSRRQASKIYLGQKSARTEEITPGQALNLAREDRGALMDSARSAPRAPTAALAAPAPHAFQVEVAPLQALHISGDQYFVFRRIAIGNQIFRQGFVLLAEPFLRHLAEAHFDAQPMAAFTGLKLEATSNDRVTAQIRSGHWQEAQESITGRTFPAPFGFIDAAVRAATIPPSPARRGLEAALAVLGLTMLLGLITIYKSVRTVVDLSERRSQFVSSVTHELKTPLTNIRLYIEMLEQGIAPTPEREQEYLRILGSESARLSRLIGNVLELARLEKKQRRFELRQGRLEAVFSEAGAIMDHRLRQEGFQLDLPAIHVPAFAFDHEVLVQILINLMENSVKFGRAAPQKTITLTAEQRDSWVAVSVSDTGPGIARQALKRIFDDFYRPDDALTRAAGGTGIGLALVKKFALAMGGRVQAANNEGPGCTLTLLLPLRPTEDAPVRA
jgi:two-component system, OmpR family, phosphate regulon sensor histidine kinase PhoR